MSEPRCPRFLGLTGLVLALALASTFGCSEKCGEAKYNPEKQFCGQGFTVHEKCNGEKYNSDEKICIDGKIEQRCGDMGYNPEKQFCSSNKPYDKCSGEEYNPIDKICIDGKIEQRCGDIGYNPEKLFCSDNKIYDKCGDNKYEPATQVCSDNNIYEKKCNGEEYDVSKLFCDIRDGKTYKYVKIGKQVWMAENLNYEAEGSKCYNNNSDNCKKYGHLYNWKTALEACPKGWHLPSKKEWQILVGFAGGDEIAGKKLNAKNSNGTDNFGFAALCGGYNNGGFNNIGTAGYWWSATAEGSGSVYSHVTSYSSENASWDNSGKSYLLSVRCLKDN